MSVHRCCSGRPTPAATSHLLELIRAIRGQEGRNDKTSFAHMAAKRRTTKKRWCRRIPECAILIAGLQEDSDSDGATKFWQSELFCVVVVLLRSTAPDCGPQNSKCSVTKFGSLLTVQCHKGMATRACRCALRSLPPWAPDLTDLDVMRGADVQIDVTFFFNEK